MEEAIHEIEKNDGLRMTWNVLPIVDTEESSLPIPIGVLYSPHQRCERLEYEPIFCLTCRSILNPYTTVDYNTKEWTCIFCNKKNHLPPHYRDISPESLPSEMISCTTEYLLTRESTFQPTFFFVVDMCTFDEQRYNLLIDGIRITYDGLPDECTIGLITYGTNINLFDFQSEIKRTFIFSGERNYDKKTLEGYFKDENANSQFLSFVFTKKTVDVNDFVKMMERDPFPVRSGLRQIRCTGSALSFAVSLLESVVHDAAIKIFLFTEGPITFGPGTMASLNLKENIRSGNDILRGKAKYVKTSKSYFDALAKRMANLGMSIDILSATLNDIGLYEMQSLIDMTGGLVVMAQDFDHEIFTTSCAKNVRSEDGVMEMVFNAKFKVQTKGLTYKSGIGLGSPLLNQKNEEIGWKLGSLHRNSNIGFIFDAKANKRDDEIGYVQIITQYQQSDRKLITRVTTAARVFGRLSKFKQGFDQEAALILQARIFTFGTHIEEDLDLVRRIDRSLIRFIRKFGESNNHLKLSSSMALYPNFIYFLRRSLLVQTETNSPDETSYYRNIVAREPVTNAMTMIYPTLTAFSYQDETKPVPMDAKSLQPDIILLLDTFHNVLIWRGEHINQWIQEGYHEKDEYKFLKDCIDEAEERAKRLVKERLPTPQFTLTERYGSQERILLAKVNPSIKGQVVVTDDIDFATFYDCLCKIVKNN
ncbi:Vesicle coat complex COPII, subunit SEC23 [Trachipleistophora hominis]|uniref:Protein transport protein SEC23 n=1 Tax=Trachipleistophora hominis TaxID=72359 RepID=L7JUM3_TRAHO|nr:Vesicle coat complex COPII, subunit SEC23 [Trachipleistophora hominis]